MTISDGELAIQLAREAGALLLAIRTETTQRGRELGKRGDREANALLLRRLSEARPDDFILSEEAKDDRSRCAESRVWIVDPLDGTREYSEGRDDWAVHVALAIDGEPRCGAVAMPSGGVVHGSENATIAIVASRNRPRIVVSRSRAPAIAAALAKKLNAELVPMGSAGAKAMAVVTGNADIYIHSGGQFEWDNCAPVAVARAHGLHASRLDGSKLIYNRADPSLPDLLICRADLQQKVSAIIAELIAAGVSEASAV